MDPRKILLLLGGAQIDSGITTYYPLDEGSGVFVEDHSQYVNHGTLKNGPVWTLEGGVMGLLFDGGNDYIEDSKGRAIVRTGTAGFWSEVIIGDETKIVGSGTEFYFSQFGDDLEGQFVTDFADYCTSLTDFGCCHNSFSGTLPSFAACTNLETFESGYNSFTGTLPSFSACTSLTNFNCSENEYTGALPSFSACTSLTNFDCENNGFTGALPSFSACTSLVLFKCHYNGFTGALPSFSACTSLVLFRCHYNGFTGALPSFATCTGLTEVDCAMNGFTGTLPSFATCTSLTDFDCNHTSFTGALPSFSACTSLRDFNCRYCSFTGYTSGGFATQKDLAYLRMKNNAISNAVDINTILADLRVSYGLADRVTCTVDLEGGTNAAPTGQGITDKNFLNANGWTVTTN